MIASACAMPCETFGSRVDELPGRFFLDPHGVDQLQRIAALWHHVLFDAVRITYIKNLRPRIHFLEFIGDGQGPDIYVRAAAAAPLLSVS